MDKHTKLPGSTKSLLRLLGVQYDDEVHGYPVDMDILEEGSGYIVLVQTLEGNAFQIWRHADLRSAVLRFDAVSFTIVSGEWLHKFKVKP